MRSPARVEQLPKRRVDPRQALALGQLADLGTRHDNHVLARVQLALHAAKASRSSRFTRLRSTAPPTLRETESPSRGRSVAELGKL